jgi:hypothetical protein
MLLWISVFPGSWNASSACRSMRFDVDPFLRRWCSPRMRIPVLVEPMGLPSYVRSRSNVWRPIRFYKSETIELLLRVVNLVDSHAGPTRASVTHSCDGEILTALPSRFA